MFSNERGTIEGVDVEALHDMRVSSRRLQTAMKIFQRCFPQKQFARHYKRIKGLIQSLGAVRDYDVVIAMLEQYNGTLSPKDQRVIALLIARQQHLRSLERKRLLQTLTVFRNEKYGNEFIQSINDSLGLGR
jgi:CHAD domain-containing protein